MKEQAENVIAKLIEFSNQANAWVNRRGATTNDAEAERVDAAIELSNWASREAAETSKYLAELIYLDDVIQSENSKYPLQAITKKSVERVRDKVVGKPSRLTEAQSAAFRIFTGGDYAYINPASCVATRRRGPARSQYRKTATTVLLTSSISSPS